VTDFDYIIVGAGSAGCVLAHRLTENGRHRVLLLEAGGSDRRFWLQVPIGYGKSFYSAQVNWMYRTEPEAPSFAAVIEEELQPGRAVQSREQLIEDIRQRASTVFHPVSTCRMGPDPRESVVDHNLKVHGIAGLRVIDASVFPAVTSGNTNAPVIMVAEKGSDLVLADAR
jgi:choline dehydrogenase-like flavoprotein